MKDLVICFPSAQSSTVEMYMRNKGKALYERAYNLDDAVEMLNNAEKGDLHLHIFDFINEGCLYVPFVENSDKFEEVTVITTQKDVALKYKRVTSNVQLVTPLMDLLSLFWDSPVFNIANVEQCELNNTSVVHMKESKQEGSTIGKAVITIESEVIKEKHNKLGIINIGYKTKEDKIGNSLSNESYGVRDIVGTIGEVSTSVLKELFEVKEESEILKEAIKAKEEEDNLVDQIMEAKFASNINEYMLDMGVIDERKFNTLCQLDDEGKLGAPKDKFKEVDYCVKSNWFDENTGIDMVSGYNSMRILTKEEVLKLDIYYNNLKLDSCNQLKTFCIRGNNNDTVYFIIDPNNEKSKNEIASRFNTFNLIYTREKYILEKLDIENRRKKRNNVFDTIGEDY